MRLEVFRSHSSNNCFSFNFGCYFHRKVLLYSRYLSRHNVFQFNAEIQQIRRLACFRSSSRLVLSLHNHGTWRNAKAGRNAFRAIFNALLSWNQIFRIPRWYRDGGQIVLERVKWSWGNSWHRSKLSSIILNVLACITHYYRYIKILRLLLHALRRAALYLKTFACVQHYTKRLFLVLSICFELHDSMR